MQKPINKNGFTFIEALFALILSLLIISSLPFVVKQIASFHPYATLDDMEANQLFQFIQDEIHKTISFTKTSKGIELLQSDGKRITIEQYGSIVRRQVNGQGHETLIHDISAFNSTSSNEHTVMISVITLKGESYEKTFSLIPKR
ncbi:competence type IV pilus minor pilin ComGF [Pontibacillus yanchengensis]|uniref:Competence protein ComGF n=1 Tax=Pontibacillus yanchengensis Y32 TaxID=1385514 RepID=A0A0A2TBQ6_9BACI|nr:competence type IV pilus minor pilin ComGF [Pontibacillus yanchengensis]KGP72984.1 hypothetical protein N782_08575 [Pontibacillus yanchengensis Y32]